MFPSIRWCCHKVGWSWSTVGCYGPSLPLLPPFLWASSSSFSFVFCSDFPVSFNLLCLHSCVTLSSFIAIVSFYFIFYLKSTISFIFSILPPLPLYSFPSLSVTCLPSLTLPYKPFKYSGALPLPQLSSLFPLRLSIPHSLHHIYSLSPHSTHPIHLSFTSLFISTSDLSLLSRPAFHLPLPISNLKPPLIDFSLFPSHPPSPL